MSTLLNVDKIISQIMPCVSVLICSIILFAECRNRHRQASTAMQSSASTSADHVQRIRNRTRYYLKLWSLITLCLCVANSLLVILSLTPSLCQMSFLVGTVSMIVTKSVLTLYQITRLQYIFAGTNYNYSSVLYSVLYLIGAVLIVCLIGITPLFANMDITTSDCLLPRHSYSVMTFLLLYPWDWAVLYMYILRIWKMKNVMHFSSEKVKITINFALKKILFLTVLYEVEFIIVMTVYIASPYLSVRYIVICLDAIVTSLAMYLMIDTNNAQYVFLLNVMQKLGCCACDRCLRMEPMEMQMDSPEPATTTSAIIGDNPVNNKSSLFTANMTSTKTGEAPQPPLEGCTLDEGIEASSTQLTTTSDLERDRANDAAVFKRLREIIARNETQ